MSQTAAENLRLDPRSVERRAPPGGSQSKWYILGISSMPKKTPITVAHGDGIGPEIMNATLQILEAAELP